MSRVRLIKEGLKRIKKIPGAIKKVTKAQSAEKPQQVVEALQVVKQEEQPHNKE